MDNPTWLIIAAVFVALVAVVIVWRLRKSDAQRDPAPTQRAVSPVTGLGRIWRRGLDQGTWEGLEETLLAADVGVGPTSDIVNRVRAAAPREVGEAREQLARAIRAQFLVAGRELRLQQSPSVILVVGVNGSGKTTTIAKLAHQLVEEGKSVVLAAADTFRAAAGEQLDAWAKRVGVDVVMGQQGGDPASVAHDAISSARARGADVVIVDTAGRLHGKKNLMEELKKIHRVAAGAADVTEVLLILDATSGQNGLTQVEQFGDAVSLTGIILSKLDGTARGGIVIAVEARLGVPIKFVGIGERVTDLRPFDPDRFIADLLEE